MRLTIIIALAAILAPIALTAHPVAPGFAQSVTDLSAAKKQNKKQNKPAKKKEEYLKAAPSAPPSSGKSTY
jgi:hypothetical protein